MKQRCKFAFVFPRFFNKNFIWNTGGNRRAEGGRDSSQSPRSIKQLRVQICGARLGRPKQRVEKKAVNDGSVCLSFIRRSLSLSLRICGLNEEGGGGRKRGRTTFSANGTHECPRGRGEEGLVDGERGSHGRGPRGSKGSMGFPPAAPCMPRPPIHNGGNARPVNERPFVSPASNRS